jgi:hypothetical protein
MWLARETEGKSKSRWGQRGSEQLDYECHTDGIGLSEWGRHWRVSELKVESSASNSEECTHAVLSSLSTGRTQTVRPNIGTQEAQRNASGRKEDFKMKNVIWEEKCGL